MSLGYQVRIKKQIRVIADTDADCEADDPFAIAHALMSPKLNVKAIFATHFGERGTAQRSSNEINTILNAMKMDVPVYMGADGPLAVTRSQPLSPASEFLIEEALRDDTMPLFVLCMGAITNVAAALEAKPEIAPRMTVIWIGGHAYDNVKPPFREFNAGNDIEAVNFIFKNKVELWQIPSNVYGSMRVGLAELQKKVLPCGEIGKHLFEKMTAYNNTPLADWTAGESWSLGDSPSVAVAIDPGCGRYKYREAPSHINDDTSYIFEPGNERRVRVYEFIDSRYVLEDFFAKLDLIYGAISAKRE